MKVGYIHSHSQNIVLSTLLTLTEDPFHCFACSFFLKLILHVVSNIDLMGLSKIVNSI